MSAPHWYEDHAELVAFVRALDEAGMFNARSDLFYCLEKPWKWTEEHGRWVVAGRPESYEAVAITALDKVLEDMR